MLASKQWVNVRCGQQHANGDLVNHARTNIVIH